MKTNYSEKYVLLGSTGYIGEAFASELQRRGESVRCLSRKEVDYSNYRKLRSFLADERPTFLVNCAGFTGKPNVDACETRKADTILGNVTLLQTIAQACDTVDLPWGHVSSGCIYSGAKVRQPDGSVKVEKELMQPETRRLWEHDRSVLRGFAETDLPNFSFRDSPCSFYSGTKALGEEVLREWPSLYIWRLRIPFDHNDSPRNYLSKIQNYTRVYNNVNSLSHREDFAKACLDLGKIRADFGIYNVTNPGFVTTEEVARLLRSRLNILREFNYFLDNTEFYSFATAPRSNTILDVSKLVATGVVIRPVEEALEEALKLWHAGSANKSHLSVTATDEL